MNLTKLFEMQKVLDERIELEHPRLDGEDRLAKKILALQVELGELANEWRGFKFWSTNQEPKEPYQDSKWIDGRCYTFVKNPLLEEYVDCLHFILSIGLEDMSSCVYDGNYTPYKTLDGENITIQFINLFHSVQYFWSTRDLEITIETFLGLGEMLGFTWQQIEQSYFEKNKINHERQNDGY